MCDMADDAGCSIYELAGRMSAFELNLRITNRLVKTGITFDREKIADIERQKREAEVEAFLQRARNYWNGK